MFSVLAGQIDAFHDTVHIICNFGYDDNFRPRSDPRIQSDIAAMAPHHFHNGNTFVRIHRIAQFVDHVKTRIDSRIETKRIIGIFKIVVNSPGDPDRRNTVIFGQTFRSAERTVSSDDYKPFDPVSFKRGHRRFLTVLGQHFQASRRTKPRASALHDIGNAPHFHARHRIVNQTAVSAFDPVNFHTEINRGTNYGADCGIHSGRIAAAR